MDMELIPAGRVAVINGYVGYYKPYATSHDELDQDSGFQEEVRNAARALVNAVRLPAARRVKTARCFTARPSPEIAGGGGHSVPGMGYRVMQVMARKPGVEFEGALYHVIVRGNHRGDIFRDANEPLAYLERIEQY